MRTIYIDVYFLINFSVDLLGLYIAARCLHIRTTVVRLLIGALIGGVYAVGAFFYPSPDAGLLILSAFSWAITAWICAPRCTFLRRIRFLIAAVLFQLLLGGTVNYTYALLSRFGVQGDAIGTGAQSRRFLQLAVIVLFAVGLLRLVRAIFFGGARAEDIVPVKVALADRQTTFDALVDSGNLLCDPIDGRPVMLIKKEAAGALAEKVDLLCANGAIDESMARRVRWIPVRRGDQTVILTGIRPDRVAIVRKKKEIGVDILIAIDEEEGTFGGCLGLLPCAVLDHVI